MLPVRLRLKALREALPGSPGTRAISRLMGSDSPNYYGHWESSDFKKDALPLDKAIAIADVFEKLGGDRKAVLELAGLGDGQMAPVQPAAAEEPEFQFLMMPMAMPTGAALTRMFETILENTAAHSLRDELARTLAARLPSALARASISAPVQARVQEFEADLDTGRGAKRRQPRQPESRT